ncbi:hypothetical protein [Streptomyces sp. NPDC088725]|uniref:hypothetical protein n=1 Tax=Streptomyces sp. NPDC088725 TaxID=3365873 RepID=UPI00380AF176
MTTLASLRSGTVALATLVLTGTSLIGASAALAVPGDSGDVKIHTFGTPASDTRDAATVCRFDLSAFNFQTVPTVTWTIAPEPKSPNLPTLTGSITLALGRGHTSDYSLPNGRYVLSWTFPGGVPKQKAFRVDCPLGSDEKPIGAVHAGGGGVPGAEGAGAETAGGAEAGSSIGPAPVLVTGALGAAGLIFVRRARRKAHGAA